MVLVLVHNLHLRVFLSPLSLCSMLAVVFMAVLQQWRKRRPHSWCLFKWKQQGTTRAPFLFSSMFLCSFPLTRFIYTQSVLYFLPLFISKYHFSFLFYSPAVVHYSLLPSLSAYLISGLNLTSGRTTKMTSSLHNVPQLLSCL